MTSTTECIDRFEADMESDAEGSLKLLLEALLDRCADLHICQSCASATLLRIGIAGCSEAEMPVPVVLSLCTEAIRENYDGVRVEIERGSMH